MRILRLCLAVASRRRRLTAAIGAVFAATSVLESAQLTAPPPAPATKPAVVEHPAPAEPSSENAIQSPIELLASRPIARIMVNGQGPFAFLIDPLAPRVLIDQTLVEALALKGQPGATGRMDVQIDLGIGSGAFKGVLAEVANTARLVPELGPAGQPRGVLNAAVWKDQLLTVDFGRRRLRIEPGALPIPNDTEIFALQASSGDLLVPLRLSGQSLMCRIDPMASHGLLLPAPYIEQVPIQGFSRAVTGIRVRGASIAGKEAKLVNKVTIATFDFDQPIVEFGDIGDVAVLGGRWLGDFALTYDLTNGRFRLKRVPRTN